MIKLKVLVAGAVVASNMFATSLYDDQISSILGDMVSTNRDVRLSVTNRLNSLITAVTNREQLATCKLLKAKLRTECADIMGDEQIYDYHAFHDATNLCWDVLRAFPATENAWQFYGATLLLPLPLSMDRQYQAMYSIATNALAALDTQNVMLMDTNVWTVLVSQEMIQPENIRNLLKVLAASSLSLTDKTVDISSYTNGLPANMLKLVNDVRSEIGN